MSATGATSGAAIIGVVAQGASSMALHMDPDTTYFRMNHHTHTPFATEHILQSFSTTVQFGGSTAHVTLQRTGDLIHRQYIVVDLPGIFPVAGASTTTTFAYVNPNTAATESGAYETAEDIDAGLRNPLGGFYCHWVNAVGFALLKKVTLIIGGHAIDTLYADYLYMLEELCGKAGKRLQDCIGKFETREQLIAYSRSAQRLHIPLPWWFTQVAGNALSLISLLHHSVQIAVDFEELKNLIVVSNTDITVNTVTVTNQVTTASGTAIANTDLTAYVMTEYVMLDILERNKFAEGLFDQLITTVQQFKQSYSAASISMDLHFNHPVIELIWALRLKGNEEMNDWFNFSRNTPSEGSVNATTDYRTAVRLPALQPQTEGTFDVIVPPESIVDADSGDSNVDLHDYTEVGQGQDLVTAGGMYNLPGVVTVNADPIVNVSLKVNNLQRFATSPATYFRHVQPLQHHTNIPKGFIYCYSFALHPELATSSGSLNCSRIDNLIMDFTLHTNVQNVNLTVLLYARNFNIFSYQDGVGGTRFSS